MFPLGVCNLGGGGARTALNSHLLYCSFILCCRGETIKIRTVRACNMGSQRQWGEGMTPNRAHSCEGSESRGGGKDLKGCLCGLSVRTGRGLRPPPGLLDLVRRSDSSLGQWRVKLSLDF